MAQFKFRLQRLMDVKRMEEKSRKDQFLERRADRLKAERSIEDLELKRRMMAGWSCNSLGEFAQLDVALRRMDMQREHLDRALEVEIQEEESARLHWLEAKKEAESLEKLKERDHEEWLMMEVRKEQSELDEWTSMRRTA